MASKHPRTYLSAVVGALLLGLAGCDGEPSPVALEPELDPTARELTADGGIFSHRQIFLRLYNRNVQLGGDTGPLFTLDFNDLSPENLVLILTAVNEFYGSVRATDFVQRAAAIAKDIRKVRPHVIALQEMATYIELDLATGTPTPLFQIDFVTEMQDALAALGLDYRLETRQVNTSSSLPLALGPAGPERVLVFTLSEVILVRSDLPVAERASDMYVARLPLSPDLAITRGWSRVSFPFKGVIHHVVTTQLETQSVQPIHNFQADELIGSVLAGLEGPTFLMGDLNSDANSGPGSPSFTPTYGRLIEDGFVDAWLEKRGRVTSGETCCWDPDLLGGVLDQRLDFVLIRAPGAERPFGRKQLAGGIFMDLRGEEERDRVPGLGIFPSDHAALFAAVRLPRRLIQD